MNPLLLSIRAITHDTTEAVFILAPVLNEHYNRLYVCAWHVAIKNQSFTSKSHRLWGMVIKTCIPNRNFFHSGVFELRKCLCSQFHIDFVQAYKDWFWNRAKFPKSVKFVKMYHLIKYFYLWMCIAYRKLFYFTATYYTLQIIVDWQFPIFYL